MLDEHDNDEKQQKKLPRTVGETDENDFAVHNLYVCSADSQVASLDLIMRNTIIAPLLPSNRVPPSRR